MLGVSEGGEVMLGNEKIDYKKGNQIGYQIGK